MKNKGFANILLIILGLLIIGGGVYLYTGSDEVEKQVPIDVTQENSSGGNINQIESEKEIHNNNNIESEYAKNDATSFLNQVKEKFNINSSVDKLNQKNVIGYKINLTDKLSPEVEKYLSTNLEHNTSGIFTSQSNNGLYYNEEVYCMNFGRTTSNNSPWLWCTSDESILNDYLKSLNDRG